MTDNSFSNTTTTVDLSGLTFSQWGSGDLVRIIGHTDQANTLTGTSQNDELWAGNLDDTLDGAAGTNTVSYNNVSAAVTVDLSINGAAQNTGGAGTDTLTGISNLTGSAFDDTLFGSTDTNILRGGGGNDTILMNSATSGFPQPNNNELYGESGDDTLGYSISGIGQSNLGTGQLFDGGTGSDTFSFDVFNGDYTVDLFGGDFGRPQFGQTFATLVSIENVIAGNGDDTIILTDAANTINGNAGSDTVSYTFSDAGVFIDLSEGTGTANAGGGYADNDILTNIESLIGSAFADMLSGNSLTNFIEGGAGDDTLDGETGTDYAVYSTSNLSDFDISVSGGVFTVTSAATGTDTLANFEFMRISGTDYALTGRFAFTENDDTGDGTLAADIIFALGGNDTVNGLSGDDLIFGELGVDILNGGDDNDVLNGGGGGDTLNGGNGMDTASYTGSTNRVEISLLAISATGAQATGDTLISIENLIGTRFGDDLRGDNGVNIISGDNGKDTLIGYNGDDELYGGGGRDILNGGDGADILDGGGDVDQARYNGSSSAVQINLLDGTATGGQATGDTLISIENLFGSNHGDTLYGDGNNNKIFGHNGDDFLAGNGGISKLYGGSGSDSFVLSDGFAFVMDFVDDVDMLDVSNYGFATLADALENVDQVGAHARFRFDGDVLLVLNTDMNDLMDDIVI